MTTHRIETYADFAHAIYASGVLSDPWYDGAERFRLDGHILSPRRARALACAAEQITFLHQELVEILLARPDLLAGFYPLTPYQRLMWQAAGGLWHGMARADLFVCTDDQIRCCELNSDTPSGQAETVVVNELLHKHNERRHSALDNPNAGFGAAYVNLLRASHAKRTDAPLRRAGIIYPTELTEDLGMITLMRRWLEAAGVRVVTGSPFNIRRIANGVEVLGEQVDLIIRHYKTDWWGERETVWRDADDYPDAEPLHEPLAALLSAEAAGDVTVVNPFGSVVTQNKLSLAFMWEHQDLFAHASKERIRALIPETRRLTRTPAEQLLDERAAWVLKSDYGCESRETVCGAFVTEDVWRMTIENALPEHFVAQRFFEVAPDAQGWLPNHGVYVLGGTAAGFFTRLSKAGTEYSSPTVPTYVAARSERDITSEKKIES